MPGPLEGPASPYGGFPDEDSAGEDDDRRLIRRYLRNWMRLYSARLGSDPRHAAYSYGSPGQPGSPLPPPAELDASIARIRALQQDLIVSAGGTSRLLNELERLEPQTVAISVLQQQQHRLQQRTSSVRRILAQFEPYEDTFKHRLPVPPHDEDNDSLLNGHPGPISIGDAPRYAYLATIWKQQQKVRSVMSTFRWESLS
jgi:hypothetical protein